MMIDVHLADGRTVMRFASRGQMIALIKRDPAQIDETAAERCWVDRGQGEGFKRARVQYLRKFQIGWIDQLDRLDAETFMREHAPELLRKPRDPGVPEGGRASR
jgi:hypothetical protein